MRKVFLSILTVLYMTVSSGMAMEIHYCMGKKAGVDYYATQSKKCGKCGMKEKKGGCCHDEHKFLKLEDSHKNVTNDISFTAGEIAILTAFPLYDWQVPVATTVAVVYNNSPPGYTRPPARILHGVFRI